ncbi:MAG: TetR/AcrR family transcriptional regulator [Rhizobiaceae bacterium]|nr:TetR/AcrR family transcriptional regulator [Rhizobiaceae bacterium]
MSGKAQFDEASVIGAAVSVFWRQGYAAASISDLTEATGLSRSSLYQRFGDKDGLFREALATYTQRVLDRMNTAKAETARGTLEAILRGFLPDASKSRPPGCLIARSCVEKDELTSAGQTAALSAAARQRDIFASLLRRGIADGELKPDADVDALAWYYLGVLQAALNFPHAGADSETLHHMIDAAMTVWPVK